MAVLVHQWARILSISLCNGTVSLRCVCVPCSTGSCFKMDIGELLSYKVCINISKKLRLILYVILHCLEMHELHHTQ